MPNGLISHKIIRKSLNSSDYLCLLKKQAIPIIKLNFGNNCSFQEDNASVNRAKIIQNFYANSGNNILKWPSKSPDINITEDVWRMISELVNDGPNIKI